MKGHTKKGIFLIICLIIFGALFTAVITNISVYPIDETNEWIGFWGGCLGSIIGSVATIGGVYLTLEHDRKNRRDDDQKRENEAKEKKRLDVIPVLSTRYYVLKNQEPFEGKWFWIVDFSEKEFKKYYNLSCDWEKFKRNQPRKDFFILNCEIKNVGLGTAHGIDMRLDDFNIIQNGDIAPNDAIVICLIWRLQDLYEKEIFIQFDFEDVLGYGHYKQSEKWRFDQDEKKIMFKPIEPLSKIVQKDVDEKH